MAKTYEGHIYAIVVGKAVKIGWTKDLFKRYTQASLWLDPMGPVVHSETENDDAWAEERALHKQFAHARVGTNPTHRCEWFDVNDSLVAHWLAGRKRIDMPLEERRLQLVLRPEDITPAQKAWETMRQSCG